jgi:hypothetical protein
MHKACYNAALREKWQEVWTRKWKCFEESRTGIERAFVPSFIVVFTHEVLRCYAKHDWQLNWWFVHLVATVPEVSTRMATRVRRGSLWSICIDLNKEALQLGSEDRFQSLYSKITLPIASLFLEFSYLFVVSRIKWEFTAYFFSILKCYSTEMIV